jgi:hypothetical protein
MKKQTLTRFHMYASPNRVGRKKQWTERITLPLAKGTTDKIDSVLVDGEVRLDFIRLAIDREVRRRKTRSRHCRPLQPAQDEIREDD